MKFDQIVETVSGAQDAAMLHQVTVALAQQIGVVFQAAWFVRPVARGDALVALAEAMPGAAKIEALSRRHPNLLSVVREIVTRTEPFEIHDPPPLRNIAAYHDLADDLLAVTQCNSALVTPVVDDGDARGLGLYFANAPLGAPDAKAILNALSWAAYERMVRLGILTPANSPLTHRQSEALAWSAKGKSDAEIGELMNISGTTAHDHIEAVKRRLGVRTRIEAVVQAVRKGWI